MYDIVLAMLQSADPDQLSNYYSTTELYSIEKYLTDSGLSAVQINPTYLRSLPDTTNCMDVIMTAVEHADHNQIVEFYADMHTTPISTFLQESGLGRVEVDIPKLLQSLNTMDS